MFPSHDHGAGRIKFSFPFDKHTFLVGAHIDTQTQFTPFFGVCINFYKMHRANECKPISYSQRVWCHGSYQTNYNAKKSYKSVVEKSKPENEGINDIKESEPSYADSDEQFANIEPEQTCQPNKGFWEKIFLNDE